MKQMLRKIISRILPPPISSYRKFKGSITNRVSFIQYLRFLLQKDKSIYWPVHKNSEVTHPERIFVGINTNAGTRPGCYLQGNGGIYIGNYVHFASNIGIISGNHDLYDQTKHVFKEVRIGDYTWIGQGAIILPGVVLGPRTIVGAGSIVTKSFPEGYCVIGGNPARLIKRLEPEKFKPTKFATEFYGYIPKNKFSDWSRKYLRKNQYLQ